MMYFARRIESGESSNGEPTEAIQGYVRVATPVATIKESVAAIQKYVWLFAAVLGALTALLMSMFSARVMRPLSSFTGAAQKIGVGDYQPSALSLIHI